MTSALAMHDHLLRQLLHQHCGYEVRVDMLCACATHSGSAHLHHVIWTAK